MFRRNAAIVHAIYSRRPTNRQNNSQHFCRRYGHIYNHPRPGAELSEPARPLTQDYQLNAEMETKDKLI